MQKNSLVPGNFKGKAVDLEESVTAATFKDAEKIYRRACDRLQHPGIWHELAGDSGAVFTLKNERNTEVKKPVAVNDFIQVDIPAPGPAAGDGHDWVKVEKTDHDFDSDADQSFGLTVKVTTHPSTPGEEIAHFFGSEASSTWIVKRKGNTVTASYHGRNETPNTESEGLGDKVRNTIVAIGAMAGISALQWTALLKGLLRE